VSDPFGTQGLDGKVIVVTGGAHVPAAVRA
jgi:hypothetical protein